MLSSITERKCSDPAYAGKDAWQEVDWRMADCALTRQFIRPESGEWMNLKCICYQFILHL